MQSSRIIIIMGPVLLWLATAGCGAAGGSEAGNPTRTLNGSVGLKSTGSGCEADQVITTNAANETLSATVASDCTFTLSVKSNRVYRLDLLSANTHIGSLETDPGPGRFPSPVVHVMGADTSLDLGELRITDGIATPSKEPAKQEDADDDGVNNFADADDDADGVADGDEEDCDLDGILDDFDLDTATCGGKVGNIRVFEVLPRSGEGSGGLRAKAKLTQPIRVRLSCRVALASVTATTFQVAPADDPASGLSCLLAVDASDKEIRCDHAGMAPTTLYRASLDGVQCEDGTTAPTTSWTWMTRDS
ncbi:MAG: hypothetical protein HYV03_01985 [Deltaproteobacteria bacterium]|nr:hypothetical protein [Deltaproteobacteria bacterium]